MNNLFESQVNRVQENMQSIYGDSIRKAQTLSLIEKAQDFLEKGKKANLGEVREWSGGKYQKTAQGWVPVKENQTQKTKIEENMKTGKESGTPKNVKEKFEEKKNEYLSALKRVKAMGPVAYKEQYFVKQNRNRLWNKIETLDKQMNKIANNETEVKRIFKELGINASTTSSTAIRGFNNYSAGYDMSSFHDGVIKILGNRNSFDPLISKLEERGFEIKSKDEPSKMIAGGSIYTITVSPFYTDLKI